MGGGERSHTDDSTSKNGSPDEEILAMNVPDAVPLPG